MHAYDQAEVVAGAGTLAAEIEADAGLPDRVLVSVGGGGLIAGVAAWFDGRTRVEALEPALAPTLHAARAAGRPVDVAVSGIAADSLGARRIGAIAWDISQRSVAAAHLLDDDAIRSAQQRAWRELRLALEPAAALPLAALWSGLLRPAPHERVALVLCGANLDPASLDLGATAAPPRRAARCSRAIPAAPRRGAPRQRDPGRSALRVSSARSCRRARRST